MKTGFRVVLFCSCIAVAAAVAADANSNPFKSMGKGSRPANALTTCKSDYLELDYEEWIVLLNGHVVITDPEFSLKCDKMLVFLENTNDVKRVDCRGNVDMVKDDIRAQCGNATYTRDNACVVMQDSPVVRKGEQVITGNKISIWLNDQRVVVENGVGIEAHTDSFTKAKDGESASKTATSAQKGD